MIFAHFFNFFSGFEDRIGELTEIELNYIMIGIGVAIAIVACIVVFLVVKSKRIQDRAETMNSNNSGIR